MGRLAARFWVAAWAPVLLVAAVAAAFFETLGPSTGLFFRDHDSVFRPRWQAIAEALEQVRWPAVTHAATEGTPLEILLNGTYTPSSLLFLIADFDLVYDYFVAVHFAVFGLALFGLARSLGAARAPSIVAAAVGALAGPVLSTNDLVVASQGMAYLGLAWWSFVLVLRHPCARRVGALGLAAGFALQCMIPVVLLMGLLFAGALIALERPKLSVRLIVALLGAGLLGLGICAIELFPVLEALPGSRRGAGFSYAEASYWSLHPGQLIEFFVPTFWAPPDTPFINVPEITGSKSGSYFPSLYFGTAIPLAFAGFFARRRRAAWVLGAIVLLALFASFGSRLPLHRWLSALPILASSRFPIKYMLIATVAVAGLAALGLSATRPKALLGASAVQLVLLIIFVFGVWRTSEWDAFIQVHNQNYWPRPLGMSAADLLAATRDALHPRLVHAGVFLLAQVALCGALVSGRLPLSIAGPSLALVTMLDLGLAGHFLMPASPIAFEPPPEVAQVVTPSRQRFLAIADDNVIPRFAPRPESTAFAATHASMRARGYLGREFGRPFTDADLNGQSQPLFHLAHELAPELQGVARRTVLQRVGVGWLSTWKTSDEPGAVKVEMRPEAPQYFVKILGTRSYVQAYARWAVASSNGISGERLLELLTQTQSSSAAVVFDSALPPSADLAPDRKGDCDASLETELLENSSDAVVHVRHRGKCRALIVLQEPRFAGWTARVDGVPQSVVTTEVGYIGVFVDPGLHDVDFIYERAADRWVWLSVGSLAAALGLWLVGAAFERRKKYRAIE